MRAWLSRRFESAYERLLEREIDGVPDHVAVIQDGNRRYARERGEDPHDGHRHGADTTEDVMDWCREQGIKELTLYAFSTENFERDKRERERLFDLIAEKLRELADSERTHRNELRIRAIGDLGQLPDRVRSAVEYAERRTAGYEEFFVNVALAYGGRSELLSVAQDIAAEVEAGTLAADDVNVDEIESRLYGQPSREVDLIIRTGGEERLSNFLPWQASGSEAAVVFTSPYWPRFAKVDFLRAIRTYQSREQSWRRARVRRALALVRAFGEDIEVPIARRVVKQFDGSNVAPTIEDTDQPTAD